MINIKHIGRLLVGLVATMCLFGVMEIIDLRALSDSKEIMPVFIAIQVMMGVSYFIGYIAEMLIKGND